MRVLVGTSDAVAVAFNVPVAELLTARALARHKELRALGPDLLADSFDRAEALGRMRASGHASIGDVLLNQRIMAGIGNVLKCEILFLAGIEPFTPTSSLGGATLNDLIDIAIDQLRSNVMTPMQTLHPGAGRRTTKSLNPRDKLWVYGRSGKPCRRCGTMVQARKTGDAARLTYWCPRCQGHRDTSP